MEDDFDPQAFGQDDNIDDPLLQSDTEDEDEEETEGSSEDPETL